MKTFSPIASLFFSFFFLLHTGATAQSERPTMSELIGVNTDTKTPVQKLRKFNHVREFHEWGQDIGYDVVDCGTDPQSTVNVPPGNCPLPYQTDNNANCPVTKRYGWTPSYDGSNYVRYDDFFGKLRGKVVPALKSVGPETRGLGNYPAFFNRILEEKPVCLTGAFSFSPGSSSPPNQGLYPSFNTAQVLPVTYMEYARWMTMVATRYGQVSFNGFQGASDPIVQKFYLPHLLGGDALYRDCDYCHWHLEPQDFSRGDLTYLEIWNEQDQTWTDQGGTTINLDGAPTSFTRTFFYPHQYAAMLSAAYDGHQQNAAFQFQESPSDPVRHLGIKNIDPGMKVVVGGTAGLRKNYFLEIINWCNNARTKPGFEVIPFDVLNFHHYSSSTGQNISDELDKHNTIQFNGTAPGAMGIPPEEDDLRGRLTSLLSNWPSTVDGKEFWLSEFGYDSEDVFNSGVEVPEIGSADRQKVQGQWLVRSLLEISAAGDDRHIDRATVFLVQDPVILPGLSVEQFDRSGMVRSDGTPKRSWFYVLTLKNILQDYIFETDQDEMDMDITVTPTTPQGDSPRFYKYVKKGSPDDRPTYVIWSPTKNGASYDAVVDFSNAENEPTQATLYEIKELDENGRRTDMVANGTSITVPVSETPIFLRLGEAAVGSAPSTVLDLESASSCCGNVELNWTKAQGFVSKHAIYYALKSDLPTPSGTVPVFNDFEDLLPDLTFYKEVSGQVTSTTVAGLADGQAYWFFVIPYGITGNTAPLATAAEGFHFIGGTSGSCALPAGANYCVYPTTIANISYSCSNLPAVQNIFGVNDPVGGGCGNVNAETNGDSWYYTQDGVPACNSVVINFEAQGGSPQQIKTLYVRNAGMSGRLLVEYAPCICPNVFFPLPTITLPTAGTNATVLTAHSGLFPLRAISKVRFTRLDNSRTDIHRLFFCSKDTPCESGMLLDAPSAPDHFRAEDLTSTSALLLWEAARLEAGDVNSPPVGSYELEFGTALGSQGEILNPATKILSAEAGELEQLYRLNGLLSNTTYHARIKATYLPCAETLMPDSSTTSFTTPPPDLNGRSLATPESTDKRKKSKKLMVYPNPNRGSFSIVLPATGYSRLEVFDLSGQVVARHELLPGSQHHQVDLTGLSNGLFVLHFFGENMAQRQEKVVINRE